MSLAEPKAYLALALALAERGRYTVSPNPMVGCVLVKDGQIIGQGYHQKAGEPHAEIYALREAGEQARGATAYVTLEPCCHQGRTGPCTKALIEAGIQKVYVACEDPNPLVAGKGCEALRAAGISVDLGLYQDEARELNEIFFHYIKHKKPFVFAKWAMSLDGKTITAPEDSKQISCSEAQQHTHALRQQVDAILVGANTARVDNPQLTVRFQDGSSVLKQPLRVILAGQKPLPLDLKLFDANLPGKTLIALTSAESLKALEPVLSDKVEALLVPSSENGDIPLPSLLDLLGKKEITSLLIEGGMTVHQRFFEAGLVNKIQVYVAPVFIGAQAKKQKLRFSKTFAIGNDFHFIANTEEETHV